MTKKAKTNMAASVRQRLLNQSRLGGGQDFQRLLVRYTIERLLYRLSQSASRSRFVLKGANLFVIWDKAPLRSTGDLDLLGFGPNDIDAARKTFAELCKLKVQDDGLIFDPASIRVETMREEEEYQGLRIRLSATLGTAVTAVQVDIGFGDAVHPEPIRAGVPTNPRRHAGCKGSCLSARDGHRRKVRSNGPLRRAHKPPQGSL